MFRAFSGLWLLVFIPLCFLLFPSRYSPIHWFNQHIEQERYVHLYGGTLTLLEQQLLMQPQAAWPQKLAHISPYFGYGLSLQQMSTLSLSESQQAALSAGNILFINAEPEYLLKWLPNSDWVIRLFVDITQEEDIDRASSGTIYLLRKALEQTPVTQWQALIQRLSSQFHLRLQKQSTIVFTPSEQAQWDKRASFWRFDATHQLVFYTATPEKGMTLVVSSLPYSSNTPMVLLVVILMFVLLVSVGMFFWSYPLWRDLKRLSDATTQFGQGDLSQRSPIPKVAAVANLSRQFNQMAQCIEQTVQGQRTLTNAIAHDLRQPLHRMRYAFEILNTSSLTASEQARYQQSIEHSMQDLDHLINQTLQLSRYSHDREQIRFSEQVLAQLLQKECNHVALANPSLSVVLHAAPLIRLRTTWIDPTAIRRAINNLLSNACRYAVTTIEIHLNYDAGQDQWVIDVCDDGPGIPPEHREQIFNPFVQLDNASRTQEAGHGLGLAISQQVAHWHHGQLTVSDSLMGGACFTFRWPCHPQLLPVSN